MTPSSVAKHLGLRKSTVSDGVRKLGEQGLVEHKPYGAVELTDTGRTYAVAMIRRHRLIETFLVEALGYTWDQVHDEAEHLEHAVSDFMVDRIDEHLGHPIRDPHGDPIPARDGRVARPDAVPLADVPPESRVRVERISDSDPDLLQFFADRGIGVGTVLRTRAGAPYSDSIGVLVGDDALALGRTAAASVWVSLARR